jgi:hypothetical protein
MNIEGLEKTKAAILAKPVNFDMSTFFDHRSEQALETECGTTACIAGFAITVLQGFETVERARLHDRLQASLTASRAANLLGLTYEQSGRLFDEGEWPTKFYDDYIHAVETDDYTGMARTAAARIDHFIATEGKE